MEIVIRNKEGLEFKTELPITLTHRALKYEYEYYPDVFWVIYDHIIKDSNIADFDISDPMFIILDDGTEILIEYERVCPILRSIISINRTNKLESLGI